MALLIWISQQKTGMWELDMPQSDDLRSKDGPFSRQASYCLTKVTWLRSFKGI